MRDAALDKTIVHWLSVAARDVVEIDFSEVRYQSFEHLHALVTQVVVRIYDLLDVIALVADASQNLRELVICHAAVVDDELLDLFGLVILGGFKIICHGLRHRITDATLS